MQGFYDASLGDLIESFNKCESTGFKFKLGSSWLVYVPQFSILKVRASPHIRVAKEASQHEQPLFWSTVQRERVLLMNIQQEESYLAVRWHF